MKTITIKPDHNGQYQAYTRFVVSGATPLGEPFPDQQLSNEAIKWKRGGFKVVIAQTRFAEVQ